MIIFENDGEIDIRFATLIGANVKESANPVGFFGTGLKYAIASVARWGERMFIQSGMAQYSFETEEVEIRGATFETIALRSPYDVLPLGFTTALGKTWEPWMIYRELWCNAHDEPSPSVYETDMCPMPKQGITRIIVEGPSLERVHDCRDQFILNKNARPAFVNKNVEIYEGPADRIFYRGIAVQRLPKPSLFTYNILGFLYLTEDRTANTWWTDPLITRSLMTLDDRSIIHRVLTASQDDMESRLDWHADSTLPSKAWCEVAESLTKNDPLSVHASVRDRFVVIKAADRCPTCQRPYAADDTF